ncbi:hypothetical protein BC834DRAFT_846535 [Gloeopeniophorella convolvens]|nr:hypothetical protein BC834DRAFT_846535 [Gloeopeniophorella convolvens]
MSPNQVGTDLTVDGYLSRTFGASAAENYFLTLFKAARLPRYHLVSNPCASFAIDFHITSIGTVVPQTIWVPQSINDRRQYVEHAELQLPIFFKLRNGQLGLPLAVAAAGRCEELCNDREGAPLGLKSSTHIRIGWPGYESFKRQVQIRDETSARNPITNARFAQIIGRSVLAFLKECRPGPSAPHSKWAIGVGNVQYSDIIVIGAVHVSAGSWMPILQLNRFVL